MLGVRPRRRPSRARVGVHAHAVPARVSRPGSRCSCSPWAGLPWLVGLAMRRGASGADGANPAPVSRSVILTIGSVNASSLSFRVHRGPALWLLIDACRGREAFLDAPARRRAHRGPRGRRLRVVDRRSGALQATYGFAHPAAHRGRSRTVGGRPPIPPNNPARDRQTGSSTGATGSASRSTRRRRTRTTSRRRSRAGASRWLGAGAPPRSLVGVTAPYFVFARRGGHRHLSVGAWPYDNPSPYGAVFKWFGDNRRRARACANTPARGLPLLVLGPRRSHCRRCRRRRAPVSVRVWPVVVVRRPSPARGLHPGVGQRLPVRATSTGPRTFPGVLEGGDRPPLLAPRATPPRVLEIPGSDFRRVPLGRHPSSRSRPASPGPALRRTREPCRQGTAPSVKPAPRARPPAFRTARSKPDAPRRVRTPRQHREPSRLRSDLEYERFDTPRAPSPLWQVLTEPLPRGLDPPQAFGPTTRNRASSIVPAIDKPPARDPRVRLGPRPQSRCSTVRATRSPSCHSAPTEQPGAAGRRRRGHRRRRRGRHPRPVAPLVLETGAPDHEAAAPAARGARPTSCSPTRTGDATSSFFVGRARQQRLTTERAGQDSSDGRSSASNPSRSRVTRPRTVVEQHGGTVDATGYVTPHRPTHEGGRRQFRAPRGSFNRSRRRSAPGDPLRPRPDHRPRPPCSSGQWEPADRSIAQVKLTFDHGRPR